MSQLPTAGSPTRWGPTSRGWGAASQTSQRHIDPVAARRQVGEAAAALRADDTERFGRCLTDQWETKRTRDPSGFHLEVDGRLRAAVAAGAAGGKLVGAGGGGFLLVAADNPAVADAMKTAGYLRCPFGPDHAGVTLLP